MTIRGIDLSHHQGGPIDFHKVKAAGYVFVFLKASEGKGFADPKFVERAAAARAAGLQVGAYHYGRPKNGAITEARHFQAVVRDVKLDMPLVLDIETDDHMGAQHVTDWVKSFRLAMGRNTWVYSMDVYFSGPLKDVSATRWIARIGRKPKNRHQLWQYTWTGHCPGVPGSVDVSRFDGTMADFYKLIGKPGKKEISLKLLNDAIKNKLPYWGIGTVGHSLKNEGNKGIWPAPRWGRGKAAAWKKWAGHSAIDRANLERLGARHGFTVID